MFMENHGLVEEKDRLVRDKKSTKVHIPVLSLHITECLGFLNNTVIT